MSSRRRSLAITVRLTPAEYKLFQAAAKLRRLPMATLARTLVLAIADQAEEKKS
jgi:hypothetical protein